MISPDPTTLFTTSGMQQHKNKFLNKDIKNITFTNIQRCLRLNDLNEVGDSTHYLDFYMIGLFSFRHWSLKDGIDFFMEFLLRLGLKPDTITIHPDKFDDWKNLYKEYNVKIMEDQDCKWSDGNIGGYCTEFYIDGIEIGNIVNPLDSCLDIGFGLERIENLLFGSKIKSKLEVLERTVECLISSGVKMGHNKDGYILKKLITLSLFEGSRNSHPYFEEIKNNQKNNYLIYKKQKEKKKYQNKTKDFWLDTFGIDEDKIDYYEKL